MCSMERNHLFGRGHYGVYICEIIVNLDLCFRRCRLKKEFTDRQMTDEDRSQ